MSAVIRLHFNEIYGERRFIKTTKQKHIYMQTGNHKYNSAIRAEFITATKQKVDALLEVNTSNRNPIKRAINEYSQDIKEGRWYATNQGVGLDWNGILIDGQNRLLAIRECGYPPVQFLLVTGIDPEARKVIDRHAKRTMRQAIYFAYNKRVASQAPAIASLAARADNEGFLGAGFRHGTLTSQQSFDWISDHSDEIESVLACVRNVSFFAAAYLAAFVGALIEDHERLPYIERFIESVESGENLTKKDPAYHLRNLIILSRGHGGGAPMQVERYNKTRKALLAYLDSKEMGVLRA